MAPVLESPPPDVAQPTRAIAVVSRAKSWTLILRHDFPIPGSGEVLEECEIDLPDRLLSRRGVLIGRGNANGCFIEQGSFVRLSEWVAWRISAVLAGGKVAPTTSSIHHPTPYGKWAV